MIRPFLLAAAAAASLGACATAGDDVADGPTTTERVKYVEMAAASDRFELQSSQLAQSRAQSPAIREFAQMMIEHHTQTTEKLRAAAKDAGMVRTHDWMLPPPMLKLMEELEQASGAEFDRLYMRQQVRSHEAALALHRHYARNGDTPLLRAAATAALPIVEQHLARARQLD